MSQEQTPFEIASLSETFPDVSIVSVMSNLLYSLIMNHTLTPEELVKI
jgi:hypothetical protein